MPDSFSFFAETALQLLSTKEEKRVDNIVQLVSHADFDAGQLRPHFKVADDCERTVDVSSSEELPGGALTKKIVESESGFSVTGAVL